MQKALQAAVIVGPVPEISRAGETMRRRSEGDAESAGKPLAITQGLTGSLDSSFCSFFSVILISFERARGGGDMKEARNDPIFVFTSRRHPLCLLLALVLRRQALRVEYMHDRGAPSLRHIFNVTRISFFSLSLTVPSRRRGTNQIL